MENVLITGGIGFIGSHNILPFVENVFKVTIYRNIESNANKFRIINWGNYNNIKNDSL